MRGHRLADTVSQVSSSDRCGHHIRGCKCRLWAQLHSLCFGEGVTVVTFPLLCLRPPVLLSLVHKLSPLSGFLSSLPLHLSRSFSLASFHLCLSTSMLCLRPSSSPLAGDLPVNGQTLENSLGGLLGPGVPFVAPAQRSWGAVIRELALQKPFPPSLHGGSCGQITLFLEQQIRVKFLPTFALCWLCTVAPR